MNNFELLRFGLGLTLEGYRQQAFIQRFLKPLVNKHCQKIGYELNNSEQKKVLFFYPMYTVLGTQLYLTLKGRKLNKAETKRMTLVGVMSTICDDLIDEDNWSREQIFDLLQDKIPFPKLSKKAQLLVSLNQELQTFWPLPDTYLQQLMIALEWQAESSKQLNPSITLQEIECLSREKNGRTYLMFATLVEENWTEAEKRVIYQTAIVDQLTNDSFDIYFDTQNGINTYFNRAASVKTVKEFYLAECKKLHQFILDCQVPETYKKATINRMCILHGFTLTVLEHLQQTENKYGTPVNWKQIPRNEMVTDMALWRNRFKTLRNIKWLSELVYR
ncbi:hypothetical protein [Adhaeribacter aquaticus]|uniref:hypothetical protein n=1 Tax=Adhaeribacter aquaticus TaxID=299567 RepID=UPI00041FFC5C|nr:hypothetical protein [Adhaeribacter aquaticus]